MLKTGEDLRPFLEFKDQCMGINPTKFKPFLEAAVNQGEEILAYEDEVE